MTILLGPTPCRGCGAPVTVVRRPVLLWGHREGCGRHHREPCLAVPSEELREVAVLDADGDHRCRGAT